jgi:phosphate acetyltransferase
VKFTQISERAAQQRPQSLEVIGATPLHRTALKEWEKRGWTVKHAAGEMADGLKSALDSASRKETDLILCAGHDHLSLVRTLDRAISGNHPPLTILHGFEVAAYPKILWVGFSPLIRYENPADAVKSVQLVSGAMIKLGEPEPKVALLSCVETVSAGVPSTVWEATLGTMGRRNQFGKTRVDGPVAFDLAISAHAIKEKNFKTEVGPDADLLIPPDVNSFGTLTDAIHLTGLHQAAVLVPGAPCPVVLTTACESDHLHLSLQVASLLV